MARSVAAALAVPEGPSLLERAKRTLSLAVDLTATIGYEDIASSVNASFEALELKAWVKRQIMRPIVELAGRDSAETSQANDRPLVALVQWFIHHVYLPIRNSAPVQWILSIWNV